MKNKCVVLKSDDWEMMYINNELKEAHHELQEGTERVIWFLQKSKEYNFDLEEIQWSYISEEDEHILDSGNGYQNINEYKGKFR